MSNGSIFRKSDGGIEASSPYGSCIWWDKREVPGVFKNLGGVEITNQMKADAKLVSERQGYIRFPDNSNSDYGPDHDFIAAAKRLADAVNVGQP